MTITATASVLTVTLTGEIAGHAADLAPAVERALDGWDGAAIEIDCRNVTAIGLDGAGLLFGVLRTVPFSPVTVRVARTSAGRGVAMLFERLNENALRLTGTESVPVVFG